MNEENLGHDTNLFGIFAASATRLIKFRGIFVAEKDEDQREANQLWNEFVRAVGAVEAEFAEELRQAIIESGEYEELPDGKFIRKPTVLDAEILD